MLNYGYVFLAHPELQTGLEAAGDRLNEFRTQCGLVAPTRTALVTLGGKPEVQQTDEGGQTWIFTPETPVFGSGGQGGSAQGELNFGLEGEIAPEGGFEGEAGGTGGFLPGLVVSLLAGETSPKPGTGPAASVSPKKAYSYALRPNMPRQFKTCLLPVLDHRNKPIQNPDSFAVNTSIMRCLAKCIALHGLGLYIYAGEDLPEAEVDEIEAKLAAEIAACNTVEELNALYQTLPEAIRSRGISKFTARKKELSK